jgi:hypothetical protein
MSFKHRQQPAPSIGQTHSIMALHSSNHDRSEYNNKLPSHLPFPQTCRSHYSRASPSTSTSSTRSRRQPHFTASSTSQDSLSSLLKLLHRNYHLRVVEGQLAVPSSPSRRPIPATPTFNRRLKLSHHFTSAKSSPSRIITIDIKYVRFSAVVCLLASRVSCFLFYLNCKLQVSPADYPALLQTLRKIIDLKFLSTFQTHTNLLSPVTCLLPARRPVLASHRLSFT